MNSKLFSTLVLILSINQIVGQEIAPFTINSKIATYSGQQIELDLNSISLDVNEDDLTFKNILIDKTSADLLKDSEVDYVSELIGESFKISNPQTKSSCGCGVSFSL